MKTNTTVDRKEYFKEYESRPEVKTMRQLYNQEYNLRPEVIKKRRMAKKKYYHLNSEKILRKAKEKYHLNSEKILLKARNKYVPKEEKIKKVNCIKCNLEIQRKRFGCNPKYCHTCKEIVNIEWKEKNISKFKKPMIDKQILKGGTVMKRKIEITIDEKSLFTNKNNGQIILLLPKREIKKELGLRHASKFFPKGVTLKFEEFYIT